MSDQNNASPFRRTADGASSDTYRTQPYPEPGAARAAKQRLKWMNHFSKYRNARLTCRHFGISPSTFYLWRKRFVPNNLKTLEDDFRTRKPHKLRTPLRHPEQIEAIKKLKNIDPNLGRAAIAGILKGIGYKISSSTVGRILKKETTIGD
jgi:putative transposase